MKQFLSLAEAADWLGLSEATLRDWHLCRKHLSFTKVGGAIRVDRDELRRFVAAHTRTPVVKNVATGRYGRLRRVVTKSGKTIEFPA